MNNEAYSKTKMNNKQQTMKFMSLGAAPARKPKTPPPALTQSICPRKSGESGPFFAPKLTNLYHGTSMST